MLKEYCRNIAGLCMWQQTECKESVARVQGGNWVQGANSVQEVVWATEKATTMGEIEQLGYSAWPRHLAQLMQLHSPYSQCKLLPCSGMYP